ncbi:MAG TPA: hypothetical protein VNA19_03620 [Pyrinomonadaceae bacterium]|jgi:hypothetical protein|nr:hypothetical protein [Pyrinomonadaceae bacterium]
MDDQNDFFDDMIDDEPDMDDSSVLEFDEDGDDDDDEEEPIDVRTVVLSKNGMVALLSLKTYTSGGQIVRVDPRQSLPTAQTYEDGEAALKWFKRSLTTSRKNGWTQIYDGEPLFG